MTDQKPSPSTPWHAGSCFDHSINGYGIYAPGCRVAIAGYLGGTETARANAHFIIKAVNNHDALVKALEEIEDLGANGATAARLGNIAHAALLSLRHVGRGKET